MADPHRSLLPKNRGERKTLYSDAERYDLVYGPYGTGEFVAFYRRQVSRYGEPVLELGCGTGRLLIPLAEDGTNMIGVDLAPAMLDVARKKASSRSLEISVATADMREFDLGKKFKLILLPANAMMHLVAARRSRWVSRVGLATPGRRRTLRTGSVQPFADVALRAAQRPCPGRRLHRSKNRRAGRGYVGE